MTVDALRCEELSQSFGGLVAVAQLSFSIRKGELVGLIGPNGAGKTTTLKLITGVLKPTEGRVFIGETEATRLPIDKRIRLGIALTHQIVRPLRGLTVLENVMVAAGIRNTRSAVASMFRFRRKEERGRALHFIEQLGLAGVADKDPDFLPLGMLKRLEVARALALEPQVLLLDEPLAGLNEREAIGLADLIVELNRGGLTIVLVEHNLSEILRISQRLLVLDGGRMIASGEPNEVIALPEVRNAYLGEDADVA